jgi:hypothetical protein
MIRFTAKLLTASLWGYTIRSKAGKFKPFLVKVEMGQRTEVPFEIERRLWREMKKVLGDYLDGFESMGGDVEEHEFEWVSWKADFDYENNEDHEEALEDTITAKLVDSPLDANALEDDEDFLKGIQGL